MEFSMLKEDYWTRRKEFIKINPAGSLPVLKLKNPEYALVGTYSIIEYMREILKDFYFMRRIPLNAPKPENILVGLMKNFTVKSAKC